LTERQTQEEQQKDAFPPQKNICPLKHSGDPVFDSCTATSHGPPQRSAHTGLIGLDSCNLPKSLSIFIFSDISVSTEPHPVALNIDETRFSETSKTTYDSAWYKNAEADHLSNTTV
jgi:hypothetical protein